MEQTISFEQFFSLFEFSTVTLHPSLGLLDNRQKREDSLGFLYEFFSHLLNENIDLLDEPFFKARNISFGLIKGKYAISLRIFLQKKCVLHSFLSVS